MRLTLLCLSVGVVAASCLAGAATSLPALKAERWVNSAPLTAEALRGKVVLVDFWEYTCVNWIRTAPYVKAWNRDYAPLGLVVVGVHAPEFEFGKRAENIDRGIRDHGLTYPIAIDNDFAIWRALGQRRLAGEIPLRRSRAAGKAMGRRGELRRNRARDPAPVGCGTTRDPIAGREQRGVDVREDRPAFLRRHHERDLHRR